jgi:hypothetical protein
VRSGTDLKTERREALRPKKSATVRAGLPDDDARFFALEKMHWLASLPFI